MKSSVVTKDGSLNNEEEIYQGLLTAARSSPEKTCVIPPNELSKFKLILKKGGYHAIVNSYQEEGKVYKNQATVGELQFIVYTQTQEALEADESN